MISYKKIHFIGIGGISMSGLAELMLSKNTVVSGSDLELSHITENLRNMGANIYKGHSADNIDNPDLVVFTSAVSRDNPELEEARRKKLPIMERSEFLGEQVCCFLCFCIQIIIQRFL